MSSFDVSIYCKECGAQLPGHQVDGQCANCMLKLALQAASTDELRASSEEARESFSDYELIELIGQGGMGIVYKARQISLNRMVALKVSNTAREPSSVEVTRFRIEAEAAAKLDHPNIVPTYHIGEANGRPFLSMKLLVGASLGKAGVGLKAGKVADWPSRASSREAQLRIARIIAKVARAVHFAHVHGIIHRDLKPTNILIDADGEPHLTDFGIAKLIEQDNGLTGTNDLLGTPSYMAPEQAAGKAITPAVDIYSLGGILYDLLTGGPPFRGNTPLETLRKASEEEAVSPVKVNPVANAELSAICLKCLEKNPMHRYSSAAAVAEDVERWSRGEPILAKPSRPLVRIVRWTKRNPVGATLIATLCGSLICALALLRMVNAEKQKTTAVLQDVERAGLTNARLLSLTVSMLHEQLEGLWMSNDRRVLKITSEQLAALSGISLINVANKSSIERYSFGLAANESPVSDSGKYALLMAHLEQELTKRRGRPVRIDLKIYKFKEDRVDALLTNGVDFARMGDVYYVRVKEKHPSIQEIVRAETREKMAVFFTRTNSGILSLADLKGRSVAFGDAISGITFWGQVKLADAGISGTDLKEYVCLDSRTEFIEEAHELGYEEALRRRGWLHSSADVIEDVANGRYDAGVTSLRGYETHKSRGLARIPGSEFIRTLNPWIAAPGTPREVVADLIEILTALRDEPFMLLVPGRPTSFTSITEDTYAPAREAIPRVEKLFPHIPLPPRFDAVEESSK